MIDPKIKTTGVRHSNSKNAWNIVAVKPLGGKFKIARVPYEVSENIPITIRNRGEALEHALFISWCFNNSSEISKLKK